jgi:hypothetical protein
MTSTTLARKISQAERDRQIDAALAEGRYRISSRYTANGIDMVVLFFCNFTNGRCDVCGGDGDKPGCTGCFSLTMAVATKGGD